MVDLIASARAQSLAHRQPSPAPPTQPAPNQIQQAYPQAGTSNKQPQPYMPMPSQTAMGNGTTGQHNLGRNQNYTQTQPQCQTSNATHSPRPGTSQTYQPTQVYQPAPAQVYQPAPAQPLMNSVNPAGQARAARNDNIPGTAGFSNPPGTQQVQNNPTTSTNVGQFPPLSDIARLGPNPTCVVSVNDPQGQNSTVNNSHVSNTANTALRSIVPGTHTSQTATHANEITPNQGPLNPYTLEPSLPEMISAAINTANNLQVPTQQPPQQPLNGNPWASGARFQ